MDDRRALMAAIITNPDDDTPRLVFADWLQEHGDEHDRARAEFIRCQIAATGDGPAAKTAARRASAIRKSQLKHWLGPLLEKQVRVRFVTHAFTRGILDRWFVTPGDFLQRAHQAAACEQFPALGLDMLILYEPTKRVELLAQSPALAWAAKLFWHDAKLEDDGFVALAASPHLERVSRLMLDKPRCSDSGLKALAHSTGFPNLRFLELRDGLWRGAFSAAGIRQLLDSDRLPRLDELALTGAHSHAVKHRTLWTYKNLSRLRVLRVGFNNDTKALAKCQHLTNLEELHVADSTIEDADARVLVDNPAFARLKVLSLTDINSSHAPLGDAAEKALRDRFGDGLTLKYSVLCRNR